MDKFYRLIPVLLLIISSARAQVSLTSINTPYVQDFNTLAASGTTNDISTLPVGWTFLETGTNANTTYAAGTGSSNTGNTYSFGQDAADRALGGLLSGSLSPAIGASFVNHTGSTITALQITYYGEQWRLGTSGRGPDRLDFQYSLDASSLNSGTWTDVNVLDFESLITTGTVGALNGNDSLHRTQLTFTIAGIAIENGSSFFIRWLDFNVSGADDGLAIDDFALTPAGLDPDQPAITFSPANLSFGDVNVNDSDTLSYQVIGFNLENPITISSQHPYFTFSADTNAFGPSVVLPDSGGAVYVRFAPLADGQFSDSVFHQSDTTAAIFTITGNGFEQSAHIIPIAEARIRPLGEVVTIAGRVTVGNEIGSPSYIQDVTGGMPVFDFSLSNTVEIGDSVIVTGLIGIFNNQIQISGGQIQFTKIDSSKLFVTPKQIALSELAAHEGLLVTVQNVELVNDDFVFYPQSTEQMTADGITADLRIDGDTDIPGLSKPQGLVDITGVVGRFRANAQLLPRFR